MDKLKLIITDRTNWGRFVFCTVFIIMCWAYDLNNTFFVRPQSIHIWRQTNSLSIALNYFDHNNSLFQPQLHNQFCGDGTSGKSAGEFPIIYYSVAKLWKIFGVHEWIFRLVQLIIIFIGLFSLFELSKHFLKNQLMAGFVALILFTSPMLVFYGINFLPDGPSLAMMFTGWYFVLRHHLTRKNHQLWIAAFFFAIAVMIKITSAFSLIAFVLWLFYEWTLIPKEKRIFNYQIKQVLPFIAIVTISFAWYRYVEYYNFLNQGEFSFHGIWPIWRLTANEWIGIKAAVSDIFFKEYMNPYLQYLTVLLWLFMLTRFRKNSRILNWMLILLPMGALSVLLLWFQVLNAHDYYLIIMLLVIPFVWLSIFSVFNDTRWINHPILLVGLSLIFIYNIHTCQKQLSNRYQGWMNDGFVNHYSALCEIEPLLEQLKIEKNDRVISIPDPSITASLYYMNRPGFTDFGTDFNKEEQFRKRINQGAKYMIINDTTIIDRPIVKAFAQHLLGQYRNVKIFDLRPYFVEQSSK